ncbi:MAG: hypothetical protein ABJF10_10935 [Chthoniobacter sp.]|uniref:hypothetical protein n=1 Tax=Chthoniobacter sp. TaxID=2510640 RepID=UPI0032A14894
MPTLARLLKTSAVLLLAMALPLAAQTVETWQKAAVQKHPALTQAGSPLNVRFLAIIAEKRKSEPAYFSKPDWPMRAADAADAALRAEDLAVSEKAKAEEAARLAKMTPEEREWDHDKARWVFERLVFGDTEETIVSKLTHSKLITSRVSPSTRVPLGTHFQWVLGETKYNLDFEMKDKLAAIVFESPAEATDNLDGFIHDDWQKLRTAAVEQFGPPTKTIAYPDAKALHAGGWTVTDTWDRPGSRIKLGVTEDSGKGRAALRISDPAHAAE